MVNPIVVRMWWVRRQSTPRELEPLLLSGAIAVREEMGMLLGVFARTWKRLARDARGAVTSEYVILVGTVGLIVAGAFIAIGPQLVSGYAHARNVLAAPFP